MPLLDVQRTAEGYLLRIALPLPADSELSLARVGDDLAITVDGLRRLVALPAALRRYAVVDAEAGASGLVLRLRPEVTRVNASQTADPGTRLAEETQAVARRGRRPGGAVAGPARRERPRRARRGPAPVAFGWCPLCAVVTVCAGIPSELAGMVLERAADLIALLRAVLADRWEPGTVHMPGFRPPPSPAAAEERYPGDAAARVQKIPVRRADRPRTG